MHSAQNSWKSQHFEGRNAQIPKFLGAKASGTRSRAPRAEKERGTKRERERERTNDDRAAKWHGVVAQMCVEDAPVAFVHTTSADAILVTGGAQTSCPRRAALGITLPRLGRPGVRLRVSTGTTL